jgi:hypothetical protein
VTWREITAVTKEHCFLLLLLPLLFFSPHFSSRYKNKCVRLQDAYPRRQDSSWSNTFHLKHVITGLTI